MLNMLLMPSWVGMPQLFLMESTSASISLIVLYFTDCLVGVSVIIGGFSFTFMEETWDCVPKDA